MDETAFTWGHVAQWLAYSVPLLLAWCWRLNTRVAVQGRELEDMKEEVREHRNILSRLPSDVEVIKSQLIEINRRLANEERRSGAG